LDYRLNFVHAGGKTVRSINFESETDAEGRIPISPKPTHTEDIPDMLRPDHYLRLPDKRRLEVTTNNLRRLPMELTDAADAARKPSTANAIPELR
jgi:hypothetical protein